MENTAKKRKVMSSNEAANFIEVWRGKYTALRGAKRQNNHIIREMVSELEQNYGIILSVEETRNRINNFSKRFRKEKQMVEESGGTLSEWKYYNKLNEFMICGDSDPNKSYGIEEDYVVETIEDESFSSSDLMDFVKKSEEIPISTIPWDISNVPVSLQKKGDAINEQLLQLAQDEYQLFKDFAEQSIKLKEARNELLRENNELQKKLLEFFTKK